MFLSSSDIKKYISKKQIKIKPFKNIQVQSAAYDLRLHTNFRVFRNDSVTHIDVKRQFDVTEMVKVKPGGAFVIHPGQFLLASTYEHVTLPSDIVGILEGRSSLGRLGLIVHATAAFVDPGFSGFLTFEMSNISNLPIKLYAGMRVAQLGFVKTTNPVEVPYGKRKLKSKYQGQEPPTPSRIWKDFVK